MSPILHRDCGTLSNRFVITPRRRYPIQQAQYSLLGVLPTVCWNGYHKKTVLSARNSKMVCSPVTVRIAPPDSKWIRSPMWVLNCWQNKFLFISTYSSTSVPLTKQLWNEKGEEAAYLNQKSLVFCFVWDLIVAFIAKGSFFHCMVLLIGWLLISNDWNLCYMTWLLMYLNARILFFIIDQSRQSTQRCPHHQVMPQIHVQRRPYWVPSKRGRKGQWRRKIKYFLIARKIKEGNRPCRVLNRPPTQTPVICWNTDHSQKAETNSTVCEPQWVPFFGFHGRA